MTSAIKIATRKRVGELPLGISHRDFVRTLNEADRLEVFSRFADRFWRESSAAAPKRTGFASRLMSRLELAKQITAKRLPDAAVLTASDRLEFLFRRGFFADKWALYGLANRNPEHYLSDLQALLLYRANAIYHTVLDNRMLFAHAFGQYFKTPKVHALKDQGEASISFSSDWDEAIKGDPASRAVSVMVQPLDAGARGRTAVFSVQDGSYSGSGKSGSLAQMNSVIRDWAKAAHSPYILLENVRQGAFASSLNPDSVNMVHVLLSRTEEEWAPRIDAAIVRIGTRRSGPLGRIETGGLSAWIDVESGQITRCVYLTGAQKLRQCQAHPETGAQIVGGQMPDWPDLKRQLLSLFDQSSYLRIAGLDFILQDEGAVLVGGTNLPDIAGIQAHQPLLEDRAFARFLRTQKI